MNPFRRQHGDTRPRRGLLLFVAFQLLAVAGLPAGDAVLEASTVDAPLHVEAPTQEACGTHHDHLFCQLCRAVGLSGLPGAVLATDDLFAAAVVPLRASAVSQLRSGVSLPGSLSARGPPRA